ncbi:ABC transporter ATP-binding protein [Actinocrinis puniceicyclus]|uniref:ABC transporter ATP-binding protein n=1 Tax=Actinocrinis puniceicyclus TaxID=977794 RepID=A0A8J7WP92_9ACTN|nr:ABC transporter ATP-binding protein [Actinocrinis puniceicyclus]MBS2966136.1 ABC transporter ATP-binding protein [Actinocrinis puniceicyclus]
MASRIHKPSTGPGHRIRLYSRLAELAWRTGPGIALLTMFGTLLSAAAPLAVVSVVGALAAAAPAVARDGLESAAGHHALLWVLAATVLLFLQWTASTVRTAGATALGLRVDAALQRDLMAAVMRPEGIGHLEDARTADLLSVGRDTFRAAWGRPGRLATTLSGLVTSWLVVAGAVVALVHFDPWAGLAVAAAGLWVAREERVASRTEAAHHYGNAESSRRLEYLYALGSDPTAAKEVRVFGLSGFLLRAFSATWRESMRSVLTPIPRRPTLATGTLAVAVLGSLAWIAARAVDGQVAPGDAAIYIQSLMLVLTGIQQSAWTGLQTELALATLSKYADAVDAVNGCADGGSAGGAPIAAPTRSISFENVSFRYPNADADSLAALGLEIPAGRSLAIVGANGAGKSTLVKLFCGLYEPTKGRIAVDGVDLAGADKKSWRRNIAAVFQDSTRFALPARANVGFGRVEAMDDEAGMVQAAAEAEIAEDLAALGAGWDTPLSAEYTDGTDLSGGQWQKVALARALFAVRHGARVLILDEPAAHLDARAEARLHERFLELTEGLTTVVISHRFSTVRRADSIVVLDDGRVAEQGTHDELIKRGGRYAHMFALQAARFADSDSLDSEVVADR